MKAIKILPRRCSVCDRLLSETMSNSEFSIVARWMPQDTICNDCNNWFLAVVVDFLPYRGLLR